MENILFLGSSENLSWDCNNCVKNRTKGISKESAKLDQIITKLDALATTKEDLPKISTQHIPAERNGNYHFKIRISGIPEIHNKPSLERQNNDREKVEEVLKEGDEVEVKVIEIDKRNGKLKLSRKVLLPRPERNDKPKGTEGDKEKN